MTAGRIALVAGGVLLAAAALLLILHAAGEIGGAGGADATGSRAAATAGPEPASDPAAAASRRPAEAGEKAPPRPWQSFERPDQHAAPPRPLVHLAQGLASPFGRAAARGGPRRSAPRLHLEGVANGPRPTALISGQLVRAGSRIATFRVTRIAARSVTLTAPGGARVELALEAPALSPAHAGGEP
jgi:hypothetical protein